MRLSPSGLVTSPTDLANFLGCHHQTSLDHRAALGHLPKPFRFDPLTDVLRQRGEEHERGYIEALRQKGLRVEVLRDVAREEAAQRLRAAMQQGADVIVQPPLTGEGWSGYADVLRRVESPSPVLGGWSYEVHDTKLARDTHGGTILQLCLYSELLGTLQDLIPSHFRIVTPVAVESYRFDDFAAFYRQVKARFLDRVASPDDGGYPELVEHCDVCRWWERCNGRRRSDDHLCFVAGMGRLQQAELESRDVGTMAALAGMGVPLAFRPRHGSVGIYERLRDQAVLQVRHRESGRPEYELLTTQDGQGLALLPEPAAGDLFLDLEGDPFACEGGREYLFGLGQVDAGGRFQYTARWASTAEEERAAFEATIDQIMTAVREHEGVHVYHYAPYEPSALKRLMGRYAVRGAELDELLRGGRFVDLYAVVRHALRAGVEHYSIKNLEPFYLFEREVPLDEAGTQRRLFESALELQDRSAITADVRSAVEGYNRDDCRSTLHLRNWLEELRAGLVAEGHQIPRPVPKSGDAPEDLGAHLAAIEALRERLLAGVPADRDARTADQQACFVLAYLLDWHRREDKAKWWEYYRLRDMPPGDLLEEPSAVGGLEFTGEEQKVKSSVVHRYRYPEQIVEIHAGDELKTLQDGRKVATVAALDRRNGTIDLKKGPSTKDVHPTALFAHTHFPTDAIHEAVLRVGGGVADGTPDPVALALLRREPPRLRTEPFAAHPGESAVDRAVRLVGDLDHAVLAIQGPPGSGKTYTGARMICALVKQGRKVGVTANGYKVIENLLEAVAREAEEKKVAVRMLLRVSSRHDADAAGRPFQVTTSKGAVLADLHSGDANIVGMTAWGWAAPEFSKAVDVLFVDEAGQMSLANAVAVAQGAESLVLLGDPQQLDQPTQGTHPEGAGVSALEHVLGVHKVMPDDRGLFLPETWRLAPSICRFTSEVFYESRLRFKPGLEHQGLIGTGGMDGAGLWLVPVDHEGNRNASDEEVDAVAAIVERLLQPGVCWVDEKGKERRVKASDIRIMAPYNAHVARLEERLADTGVPIGTVDKFQGQEGPVSIYSMATSSPEDAPRGMDFLYSLNRLNVATSRARCAAIVVASPKLFDPACRTPHQMRLANALCRYRELARVIDIGGLA